MADLTLALAGVSSTGQVAFIGAPGLVALTLPTPKAAVSGAGAVPRAILALPAPTLSITAKAGAIGSVTLALPELGMSVFGPTAVILALPVPTLTVRGTSGAVGTVALSLPALTVSTVGPNTAALKLPAPALQITGSSGVIGSVQVTMAAPALQVSGQAQYTGRPALTLPAPHLAISGVAGVVGSVAMTLRGIALAIDGRTGVVGHAVLTLPVSVFAASGYERSTGTVQLVLPHLQLVATGAQAAVAPVSTASNTVAMHTEQMGLTTYSNFNFNSYAAFGGAYLAASPDGIFTLGGATDNGAIIQAAARVGITDFSSSYLKRVDRVYVGYRTDGNLVLRIFTDEIHQRDYLLTATGRPGMHGNHARLGKGLVARYWQFEVRNQNGADFQLNTVELKPTPLKRRVGGGDA